MRKRAYILQVVDRKRRLMPLRLPLYVKSYSKSLAGDDVRYEITSCIGESFRWLDRRAAKSAAMDIGSVTVRRARG